MGDYHLTDLGSEHGTWVNDRKLAPNAAFRLHPGDTVRFGPPREGAIDFVVRMVHRSLLESGGRHGSYDRRAAQRSADERSVALSSK